jgi:hypothetical protein
VLGGIAAETERQRSERMPTPPTTTFYVHQVGPDQDGFFDFYEAEILPQVAELGDVHSAR